VTPRAPGGPRRKKPPSRRRAALLSGLVFPGLGQLAAGRPWRGLGFGLGTVALLVAVVARVARETLARMPRDPLDIDAMLPLRLAVEIHRANASFFLWATVALVVLWVGSIVEAWYATPEG